jgi:hypothetical protein
MNFLAHFLLAQHRQSPDFHLGSLLPDMVRRAGFRLQEHHFSGLNSDEAQELLIGVRFHWHTDARYHNSDLFLQGYELWKSLISDNIPLQLERKFFLFHLLSEMWLDRILLHRNPEAGQKLYEQILMADEALLRVLSIRLKDREHKLLSTRRDFLDRRFILDYAHPEKFAGIAAGVFAHASRQPFSAVLQEIIASALHEADHHSGRIQAVWRDFSVSLHRENPSEKKF